MNKICGYICEHNKSGVCQITGCTKSTYITNNTRDDSISYKEIKDENTNLKQALNEIREYANGAYEMATYTKSVSLDEENIEDLL